MAFSKSILFGEPDSVFLSDEEFIFLQSRVHGTKEFQAVYHRRETFFVTFFCREKSKQK